MEEIPKVWPPALPTARLNELPNTGKPIKAQTMAGNFKRGAAPSGLIDARIRREKAVGQVIAKKHDGGESRLLPD